MIPIAKETRRDSISRWLKHQHSTQFAQLTRSGEMDAMISLIDQRMMDAFEKVESEVVHRMMLQDKWGTPDGMQEFNTERLMVWMKIRERFLPMISELEQPIQSALGRGESLPCSTPT